MTSIRTLFTTIFSPPEAGVQGAAHPTLYRMGWYGLLLCALGLLTGKGLQNVGMVLLLVATIGEWRAFIVAVKQDPLFKAITLWLIYLALRTFIAVLEFPETAQMKVALGMSRIALILIFAFWIRDEIKGIHLYSITLMGLLLALLFRLNWSHLPALLSGESDLVGIHRSSMALIFATALIGWIIFWKTIMGEQMDKSYKIRVGFWLLVFIVLFQLILITRVRMIWIGLISWGLCALGIVVLQLFRRSIPSNLIQKIAFALSVVLIGVGLVLTQWKPISAHLLREETVVQKVLTQDFADMPITSFGTRTYLWKLGFTAALERPLFGWGPGATHTLIQTANIPESIKKDLSNLHNGYLEIFVRMGLIGVILTGIIMFLLIKATINISKEGALHSQIAAFSLSAFFLFAMANIADMHLRPVGWYFLAITGGVVYSFTLWPKKEKIQ